MTKVKYLSRCRPQRREPRAQLHVSPLRGSGRQAGHLLAAAGGRGQDSPHQLRQQDGRRHGRLRGQPRLRGRHQQLRAQGGHPLLHPQAAAGDQPQAGPGAGQAAARPRHDDEHSPSQVRANSCYGISLSLSQRCLLQSSIQVSR